MIGLVWAFVNVVLLVLLEVLLVVGLGGVVEVPEPPLPLPLLPDEGVVTTGTGGAAPNSVKWETPHLIYPEATFFSIVVTPEVPNNPVESIKLQLTLDRS